MNAKYFYDRMIGYNDESRKSGMYYYGMSNGMVDIHHKGDETTYFVIYRDGTVLQENIGEYKHLLKLTIDDLKGDDFELFNVVQILKSGYLILDTKTELEVKKIISRLHEYIESFDDHEMFSSKKDIPVLCGGSIWISGVTNSFVYISPNGINLEIHTIRELCEKNVNRKYYGLRCIPFIKKIDNKSAIHVNFVQAMYNENYEEVKKRCENSLTDLLRYMKEIDVHCKWVECKMQSPAYC